MPKSRIEVTDISAGHASAHEATSHAVRLLQAALAKSRYSFQGESKAYLELRRDLPYVVHETALPGTQILVNRNYKPLGNNARTAENWADYEAQKNLHVQLSDVQIASIASPSRERGLFGDGNTPWSSRANANEYLARLKKLEALLAPK